jgi:hypothetical protein
VFKSFGRQESMMYPSLHLFKAAQGMLAINPSGRAQSTA